METKKSRRAFIKKGIKTSIGISLLSSSIYSNSFREKKKFEHSDKKGIPLNILILGGTSFLGIHQVAYALKRGHTISIFTRGKTEPSIHKHLFEKVERLIGDRKDDLTALKNRKWDVVIDNSGHDAKWTQKSASLLKKNCGLYLYTSSTGVYYPYLKSDIKEDAELLLKIPEGITDEYEKMEYGYGVMKANSELAAIRQFGKNRTIIIRPTYMFGPADKTNRFIHWPIRLNKGGEVLVPGKVGDMVQYIDVRDVAAWMIRLIEYKKVGIYNAVGPKENQSIYEFATEAKQAFSVKNTFMKVDDYQFLTEHKIYDIIPWILPTGKNKGSAKINNKKALANGLKIKQLAESIQDTYEWWQSDAVSQEQRNSVELNPESMLMREKSILEAWKTR